VLSMDTIFPFSTIRYRAITDPILHHAAYALIIAVEAAIGAGVLLRHIRSDAGALRSACCWKVALSRFHPSPSTSLKFYRPPDNARM
jgi:predicted small integral membrane protein